MNRIKDHKVPLALRFDYYEPFLLEAFDHEVRLAMTFVIHLKGRAWIK